MADENIAKTWHERKYRVIPNIGIGLIKIVFHTAIAILLCGSKVQLNFVKEYTFCAIRDVEEIYGNFIVIFNDKLGLYHIQKAQFQKYCYHEFGKAPRIRNPFSGVNFDELFRNVRTGSNFNSNYSASVNIDEFLRNLHRNNARNYTDYQSAYNTSYQSANNTSAEEEKIKIAECCKTLGLPGDASVDNIRSTYKKLAMKHHPDRHSTKIPNESDEKFELRKKENEERFQNITTAYESVLKLKKEFK